MVSGDIASLGVAGCAAACSQATRGAHTPVIFLRSAAAAPREGTGEIVDVSPESVTAELLGGRYRSEK